MNRFAYLQELENRLSAEDKKRLQAIYAPQIVAVPLEDARNAVCVMADGEIRAYGYSEESDKSPDGNMQYLSSRDCGLSWKLYDNPDNLVSARYIPEVNRYIGVLYDRGNGLQVEITQGDDRANRRVITVSPEDYNDCFLPNVSVYTNRIWFTAQRVVGGYHSGHFAAFIYSDDFGDSWQIVDIPPIPDMPVTYPDKGFRWVNCGCEPYAEELDENTMMMMLRNGWDAFFVSYSYDHGSTWSKPVPSTFYGHATSPFLLRLQDGRTVAFWNNTKILPEQNHLLQLPPQDYTIVDGSGEDVFTNRDAAHAAITEDGGKTWVGYRETILNGIRNRPDFRLSGNRHISTDKSVHQFQAWELPYGKILLCAGQSPASRRLLIFDVNWLYETDAKEDFFDGLERVTTHQYLKSITGSRYGSDLGHCAWNRTGGAVMAPNPETVRPECVLVSRVEDDRLLTKTQGVVWNFPMLKKGSLTANVKLNEDILRISLTDRWFNCCDDTVPYSAPYSFDLDVRDIGEKFVSLRVDYAISEPFAEVYVNDTLLFRVPRHGEIPTGISYVILQCIAEKNSKGFYLTELQSKKQ